MHPTVDATHRALDLRVAGMADQDDLPTLVRVTLAFTVDL